MHFRVVPVIDLKGGRAVHAVGGRRDQYQPLRSIWQASPLPIPLAIALRDGLGLKSLYLADLDAIAGGPPSLAIYRGLADLGLDLWIDAGLRDARSADLLLDLNLPNLNAVVGLESVSGPEGLASIVERIGSDRTIFSLDLFDGRPRSCPGADWMTDDPIEIAGRAIAEGVKRMIILELTRVGTGRGPRDRSPARRDSRGSSGGRDHRRRRDLGDSGNREACEKPAHRRSWSARRSTMAGSAAENWKGSIEPARSS